MNYQRIVVRNLTEFVTRVLDFSDKVGKIWYRGHSAHYYHLEPSAYRYKKFIKGSKTIEGESVFAARSEMLHIDETKNLNLDLDWLCYLQHNRMPTRLLDWTFEFNVALYFAFEDYHKGRAKPGSLPCVWALKPRNFIEGLIKYVEKEAHPFGMKASQKKKVLSTLQNFDDVKGTHSIANADNELLDDTYIPFISSFVNERAKMQGGCFIRFPLLDQEDKEEFKRYRLDEFISANPLFSGCLAKFIFLFPTDVIKELTVLNLDTGRVYPEVENIALGIKRRLFDD